MNSYLLSLARGKYERSWHKISSQVWLITYVYTLIKAFLFWMAPYAFFEHAACKILYHVTHLKKSCNYQLDIIYV